ncbi:mitochondrial PGP phosphatase-domain-containing protein [Vararia minispora EC-137]|uniref:Mitochondrial PGP phosphatase-domain-containing protein n=1 Tax=Vararia minispora EC-137 TaxID=1314806 RepID=A0ACB8QSJ8_9AGAM|nr:mitochondrial PGP phosphatase-domain-containing protein [Vararia minispora EC-137]
MPFNLPGTLVPLYALFNPRLLHPHITVADIRQLDFAALRRAGYRGAIFDKDNCLTAPHKDTLVPELEDAWTDCLTTFGPSNVLIVSNSAGTTVDPGQFQAESVSHHLRARVLLHTAYKPAYAAASAARAYFASLPSPLEPRELVVVGDRVLTDIVLARRLAQPDTFPARIAVRFASLRDLLSGRKQRSGDGPLAVLTTGVWTRESMLFRRAESALVRAFEHFSPEAKAEREGFEERFVKRSVVEAQEEVREYRFGRPWQWVGHR